ncbi:hypothetical protein P154DRAFT_437434, partial [Amniculicola lignicola CBS 123094]
VHEGDKGSAPGKWTARKAQMMASEYKKRGGGYTMDKKDKDDSQKNLDEWNEIEPQMKEGNGNAKKDDGWEKEGEKGETDQQKQKERKEGKWDASRKIGRGKKDGAKNKDGSEKSEEPMEENDKSADPENCTEHWENPVQRNDGRGEEETAETEKSSESSPSEEAEEGSGTKRGRGANQSGSNKKQKKSDGKGEPQGIAGDKTRVPRKGQKVQWKALPGLVDGEVVEVVYEKKTVNGKTVNGSKEDPRIVLKSSPLGKTAVHKPEAVYFD